MPRCRLSRQSRGRWKRGPQSSAFRASLIGQAGPRRPGAQRTHGVEDLRGAAHFEGVAGLVELRDGLAARDRATQAVGRIGQRAHRPRQPARSEPCRDADDHEAHPVVEPQGACRNGACVRIGLACARRGPSELDARRRSRTGGSPPEPPTSTGTAAWTARRSTSASSAELHRLRMCADDVGSASNTQPSPRTAWIGAAESPSFPCGRDTATSTTRLAGSPARSKKIEARSAGPLMEFDFSPVAAGRPDLLRGARATIEVTATSLGLGCALGLLWSACWPAWAA